jgi:hypothetical protein
MSVYLKNLDVISTHRIVEKQEHEEGDSKSFEAVEKLVEGRW